MYLFKSHPIFSKVLALLFVFSLFACPPKEEPPTGNNGEQEEEELEIEKGYSEGHRMFSVVWNDQRTTTYKYDEEKRVSEIIMIDSTTGVSEPTSLQFGGELGPGYNDNILPQSVEQVRGGSVIKSFHLKTTKVADVVTIDLSRHSRPNFDDPDRLSLFYGSDYNGVTRVDSIYLKKTFSSVDLETYAKVYISWNDLNVASIVKYWDKNNDGDFETKHELIPTGYDIKANPYYGSLKLIEDPSLPKLVSECFSKNTMLGYEFFVNDNKTQEVEFVWEYETETDYWPAKSTETQNSTYTYETEYVFATGSF